MRPPSRTKNSSAAPSARNFAAWTRLGAMPMRSPSSPLSPEAETMRLVAVQEQDFDQGALLAKLGQDGTGGIASFTGLVRQTEDGRLKALRLEHYPGMTEKALERLADE